MPFGWDDAISIGSAALSFIGGQQRNSTQVDIANQANQFSAQQFANRYQTTVKDMQAAGLNPMLAYSQGGGTPPTGQQAQINDSVTPAVQTFNQSRMNSAQVANIEADTKNKAALADLIEAQAMQARSSAWASQSHSELMNTQAKEIVNRLENNLPKNESDRLIAAAKELQSQYDLNVQKGMTEAQSRNLMYFTAQKLMSETKLNELDLKAAEKLDNLGRELGQLKPFFEMLRLAIGRR